MTGAGIVQHSGKSVLYISSELLRMRTLLVVFNGGSQLPGFGLWATGITLPVRTHTPCAAFSM